MMTFKISIFYEDKETLNIENVKTWNIENETLSIQMKDGYILIPNYKKANYITIVIEKENEKL